MSKRQRTVSSSGEGPTDKRHKPSDEDHPADVQTTTPKVSLISSQVDGEAHKPIDDAIRGRKLRERPLKKAQAKISGEEEDASTSEEDDGSVYGEVAKKKLRSLPIPLQERKLIKQILAIERKDMKDSFKGLKIPYCVANPPYHKDGTFGEMDETDNSDESGNDTTEEDTDLLLTKSKPLRKDAPKGKRVFASTVTKEHLKAFGWRFVDLPSRGELPTTGPEFNAQHIYTPISLEKSTVAWTVSPFKTTTSNSLDEANEPTSGKDDDKNDGITGDARDEHTHEHKLPKPQDNIIKAWSWALEQLTVLPWPHEIPLEWGLLSESPETSRVRPEIPLDFNDFLAPETANTPAGKDATPFSSLESTPVKIAGRLSGVSCLTEFRIKGSQLGVIHEQAEASLVSQQVRDGPAEHSRISGGVDCTQLDLPRQPSPSPFSEESSQAMTSSSASRENTLKQPLVRIPDERPQYQAAETLIKKHKLKLTERDARRLEEYLSQIQREYDLEKAKRLLCQELGPVSGNRKSDPGNGPLGFVYVPINEIEDRDRRNHTGNAARTANTTELCNTAMEMNLRWARFTCPQGKVKSEAMTERTIGSLFTGLFAFDGLQETANTAIRFPKHLLLFSTAPHPDYGVRAGGDRWSHWPATLRPMVASGDNKDLKNTTGDTEAQLACNMRPTLILKILMYLDTRPTAHAPLPAWMWTFSWISTGSGFVVYVHYPSPKLLKEGNDWRWTMVSLVLTKKYRDVWRSRSMAARLRAKAAIDMLVSHTSFVHDQILAWSASRGQFGVGGIMNQLLARAEYEQGNFNRLREWAKEVEAYEENKCLVPGVGVAT